MHQQLAERDQHSAVMQGIISFKKDMQNLQKIIAWLLKNLSGDIKIGKKFQSYIYFVLEAAWGTWSVRPWDNLFKS